VRAFQRAHRLRADGVVGERTLAALRKYLPREIAAGSSTK